MTFAQKYSDNYDEKDQDFKNKNKSTLTTIQSGDLRNEHNKQFKFDNQRSYKEMYCQDNDVELLDHEDSRITSIKQQPRQRSLN